MSSPSYSNTPQFVEMNGSIDKSVQKKKKRIFSEAADETAATSHPPTKRRRTLSTKSQSPPAQQASVSFSHTWRSPNPNVSVEFNSNGSFSISWTNCLILPKPCEDELSEFIKRHMFGYEEISRSQVDRFDEPRRILEQHSLQLPDLLRQGLLLCLRGHAIRSTGFTSNRYCTKHQSFIAQKSFVGENELWNTALNLRIPPSSLLRFWMGLKHTKAEVKQFFASAFPKKPNESDSKVQKVFRAQVNQSYLFRVGVDVIQSWVRQCSMDTVAGPGIAQYDALRRSTEFEVKIQRFFRHMFEQVKLECGCEVSFLTENEQKKKNKAEGRKNKTPDMLLSCPIRIHGREIHWIEIKNYYVSMRAAMIYKKTVKNLEQYHEYFGFGALLCKGFTDYVPSKLESFALVLDGSSFSCC